MKMWNRLFRSKSSKGNNSKRKKHIILLEEDHDVLSGVSENLKGL